MILAILVKVNDIDNDILRVDVSIWWVVATIVHILHDMPQQIQWHYRWLKGEMCS